MWEQLVADPSNRRPHAQHKEEPYSYGDFTEMAIDNALQTIAQNASPDTRPFFEGDPSPNGDRYWIARWILYHIFRNRDARNRSRSRTTRAGTRQSRQSSARGSSVESNDNGSRRKGTSVFVINRINGIVVTDRSSLALLKASLTPTIPKGYLTSTPSPANAGPSGRETDVEPARQEIYDPVRDR